MRKADYALLTRVLRQSREFSKECEDHHLLKALEAKSKPDTETHEKQIKYYQGRNAAIVEVVRSFATYASVNRAEFYAACGVEMRG